MRLLLVSDHYPPFIGGAQRQTQLLAHELLQRGHEVRVATVWHGGMPAQENDNGVVVYHLKQLRTWLAGKSRDRKQRHQPPFPDPVTVWGLRRIINDFKPDLVHSYGWFTYSAAAALLGKDTPLLVSARDYGYSCASRTLLFNNEICSGPAAMKCIECANRLYGTPKGTAAVLGVNLSARLLRHKLTAIHSISSYVQTIMRRDFMDDQQMGATRPIEHSVIPSFQESAPANSHTPESGLEAYMQQLPDQPFMLFVGALRVVKGVTPLLVAYARLEAPPPLVLIGTIEADTPHEFPPGVVVLQNFPHAAVMAAWERCLFGVLPSLWAEPLGSVVYEGMSVGKAVIGTTPGGHTDMIVDNQTGLLVRPGDVAGLTDAMRRLLDSAALREAFGRAAKERSLQFSAAVVVPQFEHLYDRLALKQAADGDSAPARAAV
ncbi:MAG: glycosyltransferase family 4 protein [Anaerolineales bacterium]